MAIQTGVETTLGGFLTQVGIFAAANAGFTNLGSVSINGNTVHRLQKGDVFWNFEESLALTRTFNTMTYAARMRMTYSAPTTTFNQTSPTGQPNFTGFGTYSFENGFTSYSLYTEGTCVHAVLEVQPGIYTHLSFGNMVKIGTWTGGEYLTANYHNQNNIQGSAVLYDYSRTDGNQFLFSDRTGSSFTIRENSDPVSGFNFNTYGYVRYAIDSSESSNDFHRMGRNNKNNNRFSKFGGGPNYRTTASNSQEEYAVILGVSPSQRNLRTPLIPVEGRIRDPLRNTPSNLDAVFLGGHVPGVSHVNIQLLQPEDIINVDWQVYPISQRSGDTSQAPVSGNVGIAYQRVP